MTSVLFYPSGYHPEKKATLGTVLEDKDGNLLIAPIDGWGSAINVPKSETRVPRVEYWYEFWKAEGFILKPMTHVVTFALFFLLIY